MHLHVASAYSMRFGAASPKALADRAAEFGMRTLALTDRDGLYGAVRHVRACAEAGIAPVLGADLALLPADQARPGGPGLERVVVLAEGKAGWTSLCRLVTAAHAAGERGQARITRAMVAEHSAGLVVLLGPSSDFGRAVTERERGRAVALLDAWRATGAEVAVEIVNHHGRGDGPRAARMLALAREAGVPAVLGNGVRYLEGADHPVAQVLDVARKLVPLHRRHLDDQTGHAYLKSEEEMRRSAALACGLDEADDLVAATKRLAERCVLDPGRDLGMGRAHLPDTGPEPHGQLLARCLQGLRGRGLERREGYEARLAHELDIIGRKGFASYFLTVADAAALIRDLGIRCAIRGSGAGSLVNFLLGIGDLDPLRHDLVMERFLADSRPGLPDIDLDVESARRLEAYEALFHRFGTDATACVSMMETYRARSAIRDVGGAMGLPPQEIDAIAKAFPHIRARQIRAALTDLPELRRSNLNNAQLNVIFRIAERLDGLPRHIALHPCGVILSNPTLRDRTPVEQSTAGFPMSQFDKDDVETMGLLKLDVIGVRMQSSMAHTVAEIERTTGERLDLAAVPRADEPTFEMIRSARTLGCFQIESPGQRELVAKLLPRTVDDLVVDISLFRPGPVGSDMVNPFLDARHGRRPAVFPHPDLEPVLRESQGIVVWHEQVLRVLDVMTGCGLSDAEGMRRRMSSDEGLQAVGTWFRERAHARGYDGPTVERVWRTLAAFGAFGFCKAHAASFALPTYQSAWLKRHHTAAFFAGVLSHDPGMYPKRVILDDARHFGVPILPLDVNHSQALWRVEDGGIRVALAEVRGISEVEVERIAGRRPYASLGDFWRRAHASRPTVERLVLAGAFDALYRDTPVGRRDLLCRVGALDRASSVRPSAGLVAGQLPLGDDLATPEPGMLEDVPLGELPPMAPSEIVEAELDILGMDVSRHVISFYGDLLRALGVVPARDLPDRGKGEEVLVAGVKVATQTPAVRSGQRVIFATLDDATGPVDLTFFESVQDRCAATVFGSWLLLARGRVHKPGFRAASLTASECWDLGVLDEAWREGGIGAVRRIMAASGPSSGGRPIGRRTTYSSGFAVSPYADVGHAGPQVRRGPPARLWHASQGSSGPTDP
ncbi:DNA polymerase III subunit alpha [Actinomadura oligospora]|uniref:DNA polymerase III subunit alpha n=1 Tax=Actinomadura oligospora TaxID=111804 RepID=UPI00047DEBA6|nr:DNA polymerase III subunit alpha [Actinomadura oligospora]